MQSDPERAPNNTSGRDSKNDKIEADEWLKPKQVSHLVGMSLDTIYRWIGQGIGPPFYAFNGQYRYRRGEVEEWLNKIRRS